MFRRISAAAVAFLLCGSLAACNTPHIDADELPEMVSSIFYPLLPEYNGMHFVVEDASSQGARISFFDAGLRVVFSYGFSMYKVERGAWVEVDFKDNLVWPAVITQKLSYLEDGYLDFDSYFGGLEPGSYRFVQTVILDEGQYDSEPPEEQVKAMYTKLLYADFVIP